MQKEQDKICKICKITIHEANLYIVNGRPFHYLCWERFEQEIAKKIEEETNKRRPKNWIKAIAISLVINFFLWWGILEILRHIINAWRGM